MAETKNATEFMSKLRDKCEAIDPTTPYNNIDPFDLNGEIRDIKGIVRDLARVILGMRPGNTVEWTEETKERMKNA